MPTAYYETLKQQDLDTGNSTTTKRLPGGGSATCDQVNLSSFAVRQKAVQATWNPGSIASGAGSGDSGE